MICWNCSQAGDLNAGGSPAQAIMYHDQCKGCECQHQTGEGHFPKSVVPISRWSQSLPPTEYQ
jgi:hypothetical protein